MHHLLYSAIYHLPCLPNSSGAVDPGSRARPRWEEWFDRWIYSMYNAKRWRWEAFCIKSASSCILKHFGNAESCWDDQSYHHLRSDSGSFSSDGYRPRADLSRDGLQYCRVALRFLESLVSLTTLIRFVHHDDMVWLGQFLVNNQIQSIGSTRRVYKVPYWSYWIDIESWKFLTFTIIACQTYQWICFLYYRSKDRSVVGESQVDLQARAGILWEVARSNGVLGCGFSSVSGIEIFCNKETANLRQHGKEGMIHTWPTPWSEAWVCQQQEGAWPSADLLLVRNDAPRESKRCDWEADFRFTSLILLARPAKLFGLNPTRGARPHA